ncbi:TPA: hypothetical protein ACF2PS_002087 [Legionella pneumophila]
MQKDNVTPIKSKELTLERVKEALNHWRATKKRSNEGIPVTIWQQIFALLGKHTETEIRSVLHLTPIQMERGSALVYEEYRLHNEDVLACTKKSPIDFCEVQEKATYPLAYKPAEAFATNTCVVELYRPDGMLMKIHICTDRFDELLSAFYKGSQ